MANFSQDQVRQFYVATNYKVGKLTKADAPGTISVHSGIEDFWLEYVTPNGENGDATVVRSDLINKKKITSIKKSTTGKQRRLRLLTLSLNPEVNGGAPVAGQDYIVRFVFNNVLGGVDSQYYKNSVVHTYSGMTPEVFYSKLMEALKLSFMREVYPLVSFSVVGDVAEATLSDNSGVTVKAVQGGADSNNIKFVVDSVTATSAGVVVTKDSSGTTITASLPASDKTIGDLKALISGDSEAGKLVIIEGTDATDVVVESAPVSLSGGTSEGVNVEEVLQPWVNGKKQAAPVSFDVFTSTVTHNSSTDNWGVVENNTASNPNYVGNGRMVADMEWFYIGERADQFRGMGYPNNFDTKYLADPTASYEFVNIDFYYSGDAEDVAKSKKTMTIASTDGTLLDNIVNLLQ